MDIIKKKLEEKLKGGSSKEEVERWLGEEREGKYRQVFDIIVLRVKLLYAPTQDWVTSEELEQFGGYLHKGYDYMFKDWEGKPSKVCELNCLLTRDEAFIYGVFKRIPRMYGSVAREWYECLRGGSEMYYFLKEFPWFLGLSGYGREKNKWIFRAFYLLGKNLTEILELFLSLPHDLIFTSTKGEMRFESGEILTKSEVLELSYRFQKNRIISQMGQLYNLKQVINDDVIVEVMRDLLPPLTDKQIYRVVKELPIMKKEGNKMDNPKMEEKIESILKGEQVRGLFCKTCFKRKPESNLS